MSIPALLIAAFMARPLTVITDPESEEVLVDPETEQILTDPEVE
mgnify:CR=1 FL=1